MHTLTERPESRAVRSLTTKQFSLNVSNTNFDENGERLACSRNNNSQNTLIHCSVREPGSQLGLRPICLLNSSKNGAIRRFSVFCFFPVSFIKRSRRTFYIRAFAYHFNTAQNLLDPFQLRLLLDGWMYLCVCMCLGYRNRNSYAPCRIASTDVIRNKNNYYDRVLFFYLFVHSFVHLHCSAAVLVVIIVGVVVSMT